MRALERGAAGRLRDLSSRHRVVVVEGARAVGKTTLVRQFASERGGSYVDVGDRATRDALEADPESLLEQLTAPVVVDEAQLIESLTLTLKRIVDERGTPGQFVVTGSARLGRGALGGSDPLAGRAAWMTMHPMTVAERRGEPVNTLARWLDEGPQPGPYDAISAVELRELIVAGGLPATVSLDSANWTVADWWEYQREAMPAYLESAMSLLEGRYDADRAELLRTIRYLSANPSQIANYSKIGSELELNRATVKRYVELSANTMLLHELASIRPTAHKTLAAHPKLASFDTGFAAWAAELSPVRLLAGSSVWGGLVETTVANEVISQASWLPPVKLGHWRQGRSEVDLVVVAGSGRVLGIEVKAATTAKPADARGLRALRQALGDRFLAGLVIYTGGFAYPLGEADDRIMAMPLSALWAVR